MGAQISSHPRRQKSSNLKRARGKFSLHPLSRTSSAAVSLSNALAEMETESKKARRMYEGAEGFMGIMMRKEVADGVEAEGGNSHPASTRGKSHHSSWDLSSRDGGEEGKYFLDTPDEAFDGTHSLTVEPDVEAEVKEPVAATGVERDESMVGMQRSSVSGRPIWKDCSGSAEDFVAFGRGSMTIERHRVQLLGHGRELLVFCHSFGANQSVWEEVVDFLDMDDYRVLLFDLVGCSEIDEQGYDFERYKTLHGYADDLLQLLDDLGVEGTEWGEKCSFVGHAIGAMIGLIASTERPKIFKRLILIGCSPKYLDAPDYKGGFKLKHLDPVFSAVQDNYNVWLSGCEGLPMATEGMPAQVRVLCEPLFGLRPDIAFSMLKTIFTADIRPLLPQVTVEVHLLHTSRDLSVPWESVQHMIDAIPSAFAELLPSGEDYFSSPEVLAEAILRHLAMPPRRHLMARSSSSRAHLRMKKGNPSGALSTTQSLSVNALDELSHFRP